MDDSLNPEVPRLEHMQGQLNRIEGLVAEIHAQNQSQIRFVLMNYKGFSLWDLKGIAPAHR